MAHPVFRGRRRRRELVALAEQVFLECGFAETTMQAIALRAGASKETLYRHFGCKQGLFAEVVRNRANRLLTTFDAEAETPNAMADRLRLLGTNLLESITSPEVIALLRIVVAEVPRDPALGEIFYGIGPERTRLNLIDYLTQARERGEFTGHDPGLAARIFLGAVASHAHIIALVLQAPTPMSPGDIKSHVDEAVAMFMARYGRNAGAFPAPPESRR